MRITIKESQLQNIIKECIDNVLTESILNESFKSSRLKDWFKNHGGVMNRYEGSDYDFLIDKRVSQDGLADVTDDDILSMEEFNDYNKACEYCWSLNHPKSKYNNSRLPFDDKVLYTIYRAKDGSSVVVGLDKSRVPTRTTWGGEVTKKTGDRIMSNGWNFKTRNNRYYDDKDTYNYHGKSKYFGVNDNEGYKGKMSDNQNIKSRMSDEEWKAWQDKRKEDIKGVRNDKRGYYYK